MKTVKCELFNDNFQNFKRYNIHKAQLVIADVPYNLGVNAYGSNPEWYISGDRRNGESDKAGKAFFRSDFSFNLAEYFHFCNRLLRKEPKERGEAPCMIVFCSFQQQETVIRYAAKYGFAHYIPLVFIKNYSAQVLKANMKIVGATEYALVLYRDKLPKFNNHGNMIFNWFPWERAGKDVPKIHPTQKPQNILKRLIEIYTDPSDVVIDPCAGSASTLRAAYTLGQHSYGFEIGRELCSRARKTMLRGMMQDESVCEYEQSEMGLFE